MDALRSCLSRTSVIWLMLVSSILSVSVFKSLNCFNGSTDDGGFTGGSVSGRSSSWSSVSAGNAGVWLTRVGICAMMSAHSCKQNFLGYIAVNSARRWYVDSSCPCSCMCPR